MLKTLLITGCNGRVGKRFIQQFGKEYQIIGFDNEPQDELQKEFDYYHVDLAEDQSVNQAFDKLVKKYDKIDSVVHLAAYYSFSGKNPELYEKVTVKGTNRILNGLKRLQVGQFIFSSTILVYAPCEPGQKISEKSPLNPKWDYPKSKVQTERLIRQEGNEMKKVFLRIAGCYDNWCHSIPLSQQISRLYEKKLESHFFPGNLEHGNPFLHFSDLSNAIHQCIKKQESLPQETILILGEETTLSYSTLQQMISNKLFGHSWKTLSIPKPLAKVGSVLKLLFSKKAFIRPWMIDLADDHYELVISKTKELIGWTPNHSLEKDLDVILQNLKENPSKWYETNKLR